jgi:FkbM family methyltransferase
MRQQLRRSVRRIAIHFPGLERVSGRLGLGRLLAPAATKEQVTVDGDITIELDMGIPVFRYLYFHHDLSSMDEMQLLRSQLRPNDVIVDVGAHIGVFTLAAAKYGSQVHAFEISPSTTRYLRRNLELNPALATKVQLHEMGLSDTVGEFSLYNSTANPDLASLQPLERADTFTETVTLTTLDQHLADTPISWLKIDVEGSELAVLRGATRHLAVARPIVLLELFEPFQQRAGTSCAAILQFFAERHYIGYLLARSRSQPGIKITPLQVERLNDMQANNALFVPSESAAAMLEAIG